jgi:cytidylate kinase
MKIAIDGPAGAGKSTLAQALARKLGFLYIDTGAMYRALTWKALQNNIGLGDGRALAALASATELYFETRDGVQRLYCDGEDVTEVIRSPHVSAEVSKIASFPEVRSIMVHKQQLLAQTRDVIMDGRDIGELVLPDADFKFYLTASLEERSHRRSLEMIKQGYEINEKSIQQDIQKRDQMDSQRNVGALKILPDSIVIDTSQRSADGVLTQILAMVRQG